MTATSSTPSLEMWAGTECTVNRIGDRYFDQVERTGHASRIEDLDLLASLGVRTVRYPVLWERTAPDGLKSADWRWTDERMRRLHQLGISPIAGLLHHGSGPLDTSLVDPAFPLKLAAYAGAVAMRYPWITRFTPINEPLTTARFSGLYGHWYPHGIDSRTFVRCLLGQIQGTIAAMRAVRLVTPGAQLVMTEDLGYTRSSPSLAYQAEFENNRRWLSFDLISGRIDARHPLRRWLADNGATERELDTLVADPLPPDVMGLNYYVTSERYLDANLHAWPTNTHGGNGRHQYADIESVRACGLAGIEALLVSAYERYRIPLAITEAHLGCTREEQLRWLVEIYDGATRARARGVDVRAVTAWSAFGAYDWCSLLTREDGYYEPGLFDVRSNAPRATALATAVRALAKGQRPQHPCLDGVPWWHHAAHMPRKVA